MFANPILDLVHATSQAGTDHIAHPRPGFNYYMLTIINMYYVCSPVKGDDII